MAYGDEVYGGGRLLDVTAQKAGEEDMIVWVFEVSALPVKIGLCGLDIDREVAGGEKE